MDEANVFPPRGTGIPGHAEKPPSAVWQAPATLAKNWNWLPGKLILGQIGDRLIGDPDRAPGVPGDDRHVVTIAGSRAGKSSTVLIPNLLTYPGSMLVLDPKGELARKTAALRVRKFGHEVVVLDPFGTSGVASGSYDPLDELEPEAETFIDDVGVASDAVIVDNERDPHWTDAAKAAIVLLTLWMYASGAPPSLVRLRRILLGADGPLANAEANEPANLFDKIAKSQAFDGLMAAMARSFLDKSDRELGSILSTAREQTRFLDSKSLAKVLKPSSLRLRHLKAKPMTIYLCLPATRLGLHFRWLRLVVMLGLAELEKAQGEPKYPIVFMLEEFAALQKLQAVERAAGFFAGFGVRLWTVLQDLSQLKAIYPHSWETFLGNAGMIQAFGNADLTTAEHLSRRLGTTSIVQRQKVWVSGQAMSHGDTGLRENIREARLLDASEVTLHLARETNRQLLLRPGSLPVVCGRLPFNFSQR